MNHHLIRTYDELITFETFEERFDYLKLWNEPHIAPERDLYMKFLKSRMWLLVREQVIARDLGFNLAMPNMFINDRMIVHHIDPVTTTDLKLQRWEKLLDPNKLITTSHDTHNHIHTKIQSIPEVVLERHAGDTKLW